MEITSGEHFAKKILVIALSYFGIAIVIGAFLRGAHVFNVGVNYRYMVHTHSHIALLGWVYLSLTALISRVFLSKSNVLRSLKRIFLITQIPLIGMLVTFPFQGYGLFSIIFSTLFLFVSYRFAWFFIRNVSGFFRSRISFRLVRAGLFYMVFSSLGPWALGGIMSTLGAGSIWYRTAVYFYLHFQYNGWMILALTGLILFFFERSGWKLSGLYANILYYSLNSAVILSFFLSVLWTEPPHVFYVLGGLGALIQLVVFTWLFMLLYRFWQEKKLVVNFNKTLLIIFTGLLVVKLVLQLLSAHPYFAALAASVLHLVIGYLHWTFLGVITTGIFLVAQHLQIFGFSRLVIWMYYFCFFTTEMLIFYKGLLMWRLGNATFDVDFSLWALSVLFFLPVLLLLIHNFKSRSTHNQT